MKEYVKFMRVIQRLSVINVVIYVADASLFLPLSLLHFIYFRLILVLQGLYVDHSPYKRDNET